MNFKEVDIVTKAILSEASIESSSDFIVATHEIYSRFFPGFAKKIDPILEIEISNYHDDWVSNSVYIETMLFGLQEQDMYDAMIAYRILLDFFLNDDIVSKRFNLDENDSLGWQIYKELDTKYNWCRKQLLKLNYKSGVQYANA